jgi:hypothetical protein
MSFSVALIPGLKQVHVRGLAFLDCDEDADVNAKKVFEALKPKRQYTVRDRFDHWLDGGQFKKYHHGWPNDPDRRNCYVFKWLDGNTGHRLYGFLCHPRGSDPKFQVCVLVAHSQKNENETEQWVINLVNRLRLDPDVLKDVRKRKVFKEASK